LKPVACIAGPEREQKMSKNPTSVLERLGKLLSGRDRAGNLEQHRERSHRFAIVAPLGAGAMVAVEALHQAQHDELAGNRYRRGRSRAAVGLLGAALAVSLGLPVMPLHGRDGDPAQRLAPASALESQTDKANVSAPQRTLRPITAGMRRASQAQSADRDMQLAAFNPAGVAFAKPGIPRTALEDVVIDVIVAYTKAAASGYANIVREVIEPAIEAGNDSFQMSGIGQVRLRLVHAYQTDYVESGDQFVHLWRFADKGDGHMDEIHELRDRYRADVAVLVVDDADGCGQATRVQAEEDDAFAVVHHACAKANFSLVHEIGHLLGASHERGYVHANEWRDIMSYKANCGGCPRLPVWSNPNVLVRGVPAGSAGHDNARVIAENGLRVAAFR
jgi:metallopeptidase family M12-like protein